VSSSTYAVVWRFRQAMAYLRWTAQWGRMWSDIGWTHYADCMRGKR
jgi:hypothetical protein